MMSAALGEQVVAEVRAVIEREINRVDDPVAGVPGGDPSDSTGWRPYVPGGDTRPGPGRPYYDPESWRWFQLVDVAVLDDSVFVKFGWDEPGTPPLQYLTTVSVDRYLNKGAAATALVVRMHLRDLLAPLDALRSALTNSKPGWRNRVARNWIGPDLVIVTQPHAHRDQAVLDASWELS